MEIFKKSILYFILGIIILVFIGPIIWFFLLSIRHPSETYTIPPEFLFTPDFSSFHKTFINPGHNLKQLGNSLIVSSGATIVGLFLSLPSAYALSRYDLRAKNFILLWYTSLLMAPPVIFVIPYFILMTKIGWSGTYQSMIVILQTITVPFSIWLLKSFIDETPYELEESAMIDGASRFQAFWRITLPLSLPGIIVTSLFTFVLAWNNVLFPLILSKQQTATLPVGTISFFASTGVYWNQIAATAVIAMIPPILIFLCLGKYVVRGLTFGALKG